MTFGRENDSWKMIGCSGAHHGSYWLVNHYLSVIGAGLTDALLLPCLSQHNSHISLPVNHRAICSVIGRATIWNSPPSLNPRVLSLLRERSLDSSVVTPVLTSCYVTRYWILFLSFTNHVVRDPRSYWLLYQSLTITSVIDQSMALVIGAIE